MSVNDHKANAPEEIKIGVITVSTSRSIAEDESGKWISKEVEKSGHKLVLHKVVPDDKQIITETVKNAVNDKQPEILLLTGGTGICNSDVTIEAVVPMFSKVLSGFATLFTQLSYSEIGTAAMLSRATSGIILQTVVFCMPGSLNACKLACNSIIFPEIGHLVKHVTKDK